MSSFLGKTVYYVSFVLSPMCLYNLTEEVLSNLSSAISRWSDKFRVNLVNIVQGAGILSTLGYIVNISTYRVT